MTLNNSDIDKNLLNSLPIRSYPWDGQEWFIGIDLALICNKSRSHFKDFPRSLKKKGITDGCFKLVDSDLQKFKKTLFLLGVNSYNHSNCLLICTRDIAEVYLSIYYPVPSTTTDKSLSVDKNKVESIEKGEVESIEKGEVESIEKGEVKEEREILYNTEVSKEFKEYVDRYNLKYVVWNYQPWFVGSQLSKVIGKDKYHFNYFGNNNRVKTDVKCILLKGPALTQFKQILESLDKSIKKELGDLKFYTGLFICDWRAALEYLKFYESREKPVEQSVDIKELIDKLQILTEDLNRLSTQFLEAVKDIGLT